MDKKPLNKRLILAVVFWAATIIWMAVIFSMSAKTAAQSSGMSGGLIERLATLFKAGFSDLSAAEQAVYIESLQGIVRTVAHLLEFCFLGFLLSGGFKFSLPSKFKFTLFAVGTGWIYSLTDEVHQLFVPGRAFQIKDIAVDWAGVALGVAFGCMVFAIARLIIITKKKSCDAQ